MEFIKDPVEIEETSMRIISNAVPALLGLPLGERAICQRMIHTTGDPDIYPLIKIHKLAVEQGLHALKSGKPIFADVHMLASGINKSKLKQLNVELICLIDDPDIAADAKKTGRTRAMTALNQVKHRLDGGIIAIGNAPTALFELCRLYKANEINPALVIGTPVGFVGAKESKEVLEDSGIPYVTIEGTRGGSTIAASCVNALLKLL